MTIVGFNFTNIKAEKKANASGKININNNVAIKNLEKIKLPLGSNAQDALKFTFNFLAKYEPNAGEIELTGELIYLDSEKRVGEIEKRWAKEKKIENTLMTELLNHVLSRANIEAILLSREINLPPCIPMPRVNAAVAEEKAKPKS